MKKLFSLRWGEILVLSPIIFAAVAYGQFAYESLVVGSTPKILTAATYGAGIESAYLTCEINSMRFTLDGTQVPTSAGVGHLWCVGTSKTFNKYEIAKFKAVRASGTDAVLKVTYY